MTAPLLPIDRLAGIALRYPRWLLLALLVSLHLTLVQGAAGQLYFMVSIGLAILWQPFVRTERRLSPGMLVFIAATIAVSVILFSRWVLTAWILLLAGVVGGKIFFHAARWTRAVHLMALGYLVVALLLIALPPALPQISLPAELDLLARNVLPFLFLIMAAIPDEAEAERSAEAADFVYSIFVFLLLAVLILSALALMTLFGYGYTESLLRSLLGLGTVLLVLGWAWNPHAGFGGFGSFFSRQVFSVGMPLEQWLHTLADLAQRCADPHDLLDIACADMVRRLPWVKGGDWRDETGQGEFGVRSGRRTEFCHGGLVLGIYTAHALSPSLAWHFELIAQLLGEFHADLLRARKLKHLSYVEAVHETGARLTHDVKNLLQSLNALCAAASAEDGEPSAELVALLRRQLPAITQRLAQTLDKLRVPQEDVADDIPAVVWLDSLRRRFGGAGIEGVVIVDEPLPGRLSVPAALFDSAAENLLQNAQEKRREEPSVTARIALRVEGGRAQLDVEDDGSAVPAKLAARLLREPVASERGLGIGLYQVARQAELAGYRLVLSENRDGCVRFTLAPA